MLTVALLEAGYSSQRSVVGPFDVATQRGTLVCVLGRNGAGKSTLMRTLAGLQPALAGGVSLGGMAVASMSAQDRARRIAVVTTHRANIPGLTVADVVALGRSPFTGWTGKLGPQDLAACEESLAYLQLEGFRDRWIDELSDGERQRVMIARALAQRPELMVLDEVTAFLDLPGRVDALNLLRRHSAQTGAIVLLSSHDLELSLQLAQQLWLLDGSGIVHVGTPDNLIAQGLINRAFDTPDVRFAPEFGRFAVRAT
jgi:iron complex transport system ATP-binding protein